MNDEYTPEVLAVVCPVCCAAITGKCLVHKRTGGMEYLERPHVNRVILAELIARMHLTFDEVLKSEEFRSLSDSQND